MHGNYSPHVGSRQGYELFIQQKYVFLDPQQLELFYCVQVEYHLKHEIRYHKELHRMHAGAHEIILRIQQEESQTQINEQQTRNVLEM